MSQSRTRLRHLLVLDFEATCDREGFDLSRQEIIEFPVAAVDLHRLDITARFTQIVRPTQQPVLTEFCRELTSIRQEEVEAAEPIATVASEFERWLDDHDLRAASSLAVTCGDWDLNIMWPKQRRRAGLAPIEHLERWCNLKRVFSLVMNRKASGMMSMLRQLGIEHVGHHHRGADDVTNLAAICIELARRGAQFRETGPRRSSMAK